ncbi:MAG: hypothetical protein WA051_02585 [Minisyncoccia bacterium]
MEPNKTSKVLKWSLIIGIVVVLNLFFNYALSLIYKQPDFALFCPNTAQVVEANTKDSCVAKGGQWNENTAYSPQKTEAKGYCDLQFTCRQDYDSAQKSYDRNVFVTLVILGALCVAGGNFMKGNMTIGQSLSLAGVLSFIVASMRYWTSANDAVKVIILAIALIILIWVALKKFKDQI